MVRDGVAEVHCAAAEVGQGVVGVIEQVARTELPELEIVLVPAATASVGSAGSASASRMTWMAAGAVQLARRAAAEELPGAARQRGRGRRRARVSPPAYRPARSRDRPGDRESAPTSRWPSPPCAVVVEADVELGLTRVVWIGTAQDVGRAINPLAVLGQVEGGTAQGLGLALMEELQVRDGAIVNASFTDYLIPTFLDMPPLDVELIEEAEPDAPYGVKGVGEPPTVVSTAAVAAALRDATGRELARSGQPRRARRSHGR